VRLVRKADQRNGCDDGTGSGREGFDVKHDVGGHGSDPTPNMTANAPAAIRNKTTGKIRMQDASNPHLPMVSTYIHGTEINTHSPQSTIKRSNTITASPSHSNRQGQETHGEQGAAGEIGEFVKHSDAL
jgi:hypothetical protein